MTYSSCALHNRQLLLFLALQHHCTTQVIEKHHCTTHYVIIMSQKSIAQQARQLMQSRIRRTAHARYYNLLASSSRRTRHRLVDSMRESIHDLRCDFLCLQDTQSKRTRPRRGMAVLINPRRACAARVTEVVLCDCVDAYSDTTGYEAVH